MLGEQDPEETIQKLHFYNQKSAIPPFWALGYHQSRWGYRDITALQNVISNFKKNDIPLDTLWSDLNYMIDS
jgi:alpha-glucosidase (family GH31 glycosyl hydrolase)